MKNSWMILLLEILFNCIYYLKNSYVEFSKIKFICITHLSLSKLNLWKFQDEYGNVMFVRATSMQIR